MRSDDLACAHCGGIVANGGCPVCRITRDELNRQRFSVPAPILALIATLVALMLVYVAHHAV
jgi:hypothetical protein